MTNREWMLKQMQNMSDEEIAEMIAGAVYICNEQRSKGICEGRICDECTLDWLKGEHKEKIKLSEAERVILENLDKRYEWIARDKDGDLYIYSLKPCRIPHISYEVVGGETESMDLFNHLFQFIKWENEEVYNIQELLK